MNWKMIIHAINSICKVVSSCENYAPKKVGY